MAISNIRTSPHPIEELWTLPLKNLGWYSHLPLENFLKIGGTDTAAPWENNGLLRQPDLFSGPPNRARGGGGGGGGGVWIKKKRVAQFG